jgi:hypothetical protein
VDGNGPAGNGGGGWYYNNSVTLAAGDSVLVAVGGPGGGGGSSSGGGGGSAGAGYTVSVDGKYLNLESVRHLIGPNALKEALDTTPKEFAPGSYMTRGAIGCALSHRDAYINILRDDHDKVLILEDDVVLDDNFNDVLKDLDKITI